MDIVNIHVADPDDETAMPIYDGIMDHVNVHLIPGDYPATATYADGSTRHGMLTVHAPTMVPDDSQTTPTPAPDAWSGDPDVRRAWGY